NIAHTSWFFETFILREFVPAYQPFHPDFLWLFNSYYNSVSDQPEKKLRASFSRPALSAILDYRSHVDAAIETLLAAGAPAEAERRLVLGLHHEQQHQELLVTDIKHAMWSNPLRPAYHEGPAPGARPEDQMTRQLTPQRWRSYAGGVEEIGYRGPGFCFDNEQPRHRVYLEPFELGSRPVSCAEYLQFMEDGGYRRPDLWLAEGWQNVQQEQWRAPLYWHRDQAEGEWSVFTLRGELPLNALLATPVCHVSYYEADAFARWARCKLPTEAEWEVAAAEALGEGLRWNELDLLEGGALHPAASTPSDCDQLCQLLGGVWEWTASAYLGYPGYNALPGALGEYNGKFMSNQMVLRGGSVGTPASHIRETYRNFFSPGTRWQFSGIRLARR
ncbi:MAG TPA: ergothioneine biosynthesis protein EgtB, partial [Acidobacteriaceae bacterium]